MSRKARVSGITGTSKNKQVQSCVSAFSWGQLNHSQAEMQLLRLGNMFIKPPQATCRLTKALASL